MAKTKLLEKIRMVSAVAIVVLVTVCLFSCENKDKKVLKLAISPYQDLAMIENIDQLKLNEKYKVDVKLVTLPWEEIISAIGSVGETVDVGFASYIEYITKSENLNKNTTDSILFIYPAYVFAGGGFTTFKNDFPVFTEATVKDTQLVKKFLSYRIGAQKNSMFDMALYQLANYAKVDIKQLKLTDVSMADGILGLQAGSLDFASAGLTQRNEVEKRGGKVALNFNTLGFADLTGFICKKSVYEKRRTEIEALIKMWFECVDYIMSDVDKHVGIATLPYLDKNASTKYTIESYKTAISQEVFPRSITEAHALILSDTAHFSGTKIYQAVSNYLFINKKVASPPVQPRFIHIN
jgi:ABC-type nitrate/sulfonate/bicarbonate transport system substrate-binding protein